MKKLILIALLLAASTARADFASEASKYVGYQIVAVKTVSKWVDPSDGKSNDSFEGCNYGRVIIFDDNTGLKCSSYGYHYAYRPQAVILSNGRRFVMIVDGDTYDMTR